MTITSTERAAEHALIRLGIPTDQYRTEPSVANPYGVPADLRAGYLAQLTDPRRVEQLVRSAAEQEASAVHTSAEAYLDKITGYEADPRKPVDFGAGRTLRHNAARLDVRAWDAHRSLLTRAQIRLRDQGVARRQRAAADKVHTCAVLGVVDEHTQLVPLPGSKHERARLSPRGYAALVAALIDTVSDADREQARRFLAARGYDVAGPAAPAPSRRKK